MTSQPAEGTAIPMPTVQAYAFTDIDDAELTASLTVYHTHVRIAMPYVSNAVRHLDTTQARALAAAIIALADHIDAEN